MLRQISLALPPPAGARWLENALLDERAVAALAGLNRDFLALAGDLAAARPDGAALGLPAPWLAAIARAGTAVGPQLRLPFALFDLRFRDARYWRSQALAAGSVHDAHGAAAVDLRRLRFTRTALTFAWHLVQRDAAAARLAFGLDGETAQVIAELPVGSLDAVARSTAPALAARFGSRERFWELLMGEPAQRAAAPERLLRMSLLGQQLQGMDAARARHLHRRARRGGQA